MSNREDPMHRISYIAIDIQCVSDRELQACISSLLKSLESNDVIVYLIENRRDISLIDVYYFCIYYLSVIC
jgi:hypothetical protein